MAETKTIQFDFGEVALIRNPRSKYMRLKIHPEKGIVVSLPLGHSEKHAIEFIQQKENWIRKSLAKTQVIRQKNTLFNEQTDFKTRNHQLSIAKHAKASLKYEVRKGVMHIFYPEFASIEDERIQDFIRHTITETLRFEAKESLPKQTHELAALLGLQCGAVTVRNNKSRWGSCSGKNNISLNIHLMRIPEHLCDYVILHELAHIKHKNHSKAFWDFLEEICPGAKVLDKELNEYHLRYW